MANCRGCGAEIKFIKLESGKFNPVDTELLSIQDNFINPDEMVVNKNGKTGRLKNLTEGYISHYSTCPNADDFRKRSN